MVTSKFYRPQMAALSGKEKIFLGLAEEAGLNYFVPSEMTTRKVVDARNIGGGAHVTYSFSRAVRNNRFATMSGGAGEYGVSGISFRLLYEFLCEAFNGGEYFIDTYFAAIFDTRSVSYELSQINDSIVYDIEEEKALLEESLVQRKSGELDMRYTVNKRYAALKAWKNPVRVSECTRVAEKIKRDIVSCLAAGRIPLRKSAVSDSTRAKRNRFIGLGKDKFFFASGQLIEHLKIYVELEEVA